MEAGLACLPPESLYGALVADVIPRSEEHPDDWIEAWNKTVAKWNQREPWCEGAAGAFDVDTKLNGARSALGMLYGEGDVGRTMTIFTRCGQDFGCNQASALGILGVVMGLEAIPNEHKGGIEDIADQLFSYTDSSFRPVVDSTKKRAVEIAERHGGRLEGDWLMVRTQDAVPAKLEVWNDFGSPVERVPVTDTRWSRKARSDGKLSRWGPKHTLKTSGHKGGEAAINFEGAGAIISGFYRPTGGTADIYLDSELDRAVDASVDEDRPKGWEAVWHNCRLEAGKHSQGIA